MNGEKSGYGIYRPSLWCNYEGINNDDKMMV
jgi:hypothetical protein